MAFFNATQLAAAEGREVALVALVDLDFPNTPLPAWTGTGVLDLDGKEWLGTGEFGSMSEITFGENDSADKMTFQLSGVSPDLLTEVNDAESVRGRDVVVYGQFMDAVTAQPLDSKFHVRSLIMDAIGYAANGPAERTISLTAETIWTSRNLASFARYSDRDQKARFPGDRGCEFVATLRSKRLPWPTFALALFAALPLIEVFGRNGNGVLY